MRRNLEQQGHFRENEIVKCKISPKPSLLAEARFVFYDPGFCQRRYFCHDFTSSGANGPDENKYALGLVHSPQVRPIRVNEYLLNKEQIDDSQATII